MTGVKKADPTHGRHIAKINFSNVHLQAWKPSAHVWSTFVSPASPQFLNQEPPRAQQLRLPNFLVIPHLRHTELGIIGVGMVGIVYGDICFAPRTDLGTGERHIKSQSSKKKSQKSNNPTCVSFPLKSHLPLRLRCTQPMQGPFFKVKCL